MLRVQVKSDLEINTQRSRRFCPKKFKKGIPQNNKTNSAVKALECFNAKKSTETHMQNCRGFILYIEYQSVCPFVRIGSPGPPLPLASVSPPPVSKGGGATLRVRGWGGPVRTIGEKAWHSVYFVYRQIRVYLWRDCIDKIDFMKNPGSLVQGIGLLLFNSGTFYPPPPSISPPPPL